MVQGTFRPERDAGAAPEPPVGAPDKPGTLTGEAQAEWNRMVQRLRQSRTLSTVDGALLWSYCRLWADCCRLQTDADALPVTWYSKVSVDGAGVEHHEPKLHPVFNALKQYRLALRVMLVEFGLTPLARNRVKASGDATPAVDPKKARFLSALTKS